MLRLRLRHRNLQLNSYAPVAEMVDAAGSNPVER